MQDQATYLAGLLYDGVMSPEAWAAGLEVLRRALGADELQWVPLSIADSASASDRATRRAAVLQALPRGWGVDADADAEADDAHPAPPENLQGMRLWRFRSGVPSSQREMLAVELRPDGQPGALLALIRQRASPSETLPAQSLPTALLVGLAPHLERIAGLRARAAALEKKAHWCLAALGCLPQGVAVVDSGGRLHYANPAAERLLEAGGPLACWVQRLRCADPAGEARLVLALAAACPAKGRGRASAISLALGPARLAVTFLPLDPHRAGMASRQPVALVVLVDPDSPAGLKPAVVQEMLGLSPTETRLALLLAAGKTVKEFAALENCSWHTARTHLKNLMRKTRSQRQLDVVGLLQSLRLG